MTPQEYLRQGQLNECLDALQAQVRQEPAEPKHRVFLFQLLAVLGKWDRALSQLTVAAEMDPKCGALSQIYAPAIQSEVLRGEVFAGKRTPIIFGEPEPWMGLLVQANELLARGQHAASNDLRSQALEQAPAVTGRVDGRAFEWIADADPRLGPMLELILNGRYCWVPFHRIQTVRFEGPTDLRDVVWLPAQLRWTNGGEAVGLVPVRYPGSETAEDPAIRTSRKTRWAAEGGGPELGLGQRLLATDEADFPLLDVRTIEVGEPPPGGEAGDSPAGEA